MLVRPSRISTQPRHFALLGLTLLAALLFSAMAALPASAHSTLLSATPEDGSELDEAPEAVVLEFNEDITNLGSDIVVTGPDGDDAAASETEIAGPEVSRPLAQDLPAGEYSVSWRVVSTDGHPISGEFTFTLTEEAGASASAGTNSDGQDASSEATTDQSATTSPTEDAPSGSNASADAAGANDASADDSAADTADEGTSAGGIALFVVIALVVIGIIVTLIVRMRRQQ